VALTVAGSDSGGGAGIQADLKTFQAHGVFGTSAITCITAQNPDRVSAVQAVQPKVVAAQMARVFEAFPVGGAKTGMLYNRAIIEAVANGFRQRRFKNLVVDPVMVATSGALLLKRDALTALTRLLFPQALVITPNLAELAVLSGKQPRNLAELRAAARGLADQFGVACLAKGGHLPLGGRVVDVLYDGRQFHEFHSRYIRNIQPHGAGCAFSAAIAANLALGFGLVESVARARRFISRALRSAIRVGRYRALKI
jgi:hydroxymethylpyrimidine/phosphomethylpyrimidine kinase